MKQTIHLLKFGVVCAVAAGLSACAKLEDRARGYLASSVEVWAVVDGQLLRGEAQLHDNRTGTLSIGSGLTASPMLSCSGRLARTGTTAASLDVRCNTGLTLVMSAAMLAETQGYAYGTGSDGQAVSLTMGLTPDRAVAYLRPPEGKQLLAMPKKPFLELR